MKNVNKLGKNIPGIKKASTKTLGQSVPEGFEEQ